MPKFIIGVDGGGTKTAAVKILVADSILPHDLPALIQATKPTRVVTGSTNWNSVGDGEAKQNLFAAFDRVLGIKKGLPPPPKNDDDGDDDDEQKAPPPLPKEKTLVTHVVLGMACVDLPEDKVKLSKWIDEYFGAATGVTRFVHGDAIIALASGTDGFLHGINLISGTGVIAYGRNIHHHTGEHREARAAGFGPLLGDEGSGYSIGAAVLKAVMTEFDDRDDHHHGLESHSVLTRLVLERLGLKSPEDLIAWAYGSESADVSWAKVAALAPVCFEAHRQEKDVVAGKILQSVIKDLSGYVAKVFHKLEFHIHHHDHHLDGKSSSTPRRRQHHEPHDPIPVVLSGGIATQAEIFEGVSKAVTEMLPEHRLSFRTPRVEPEVAAALLALFDDNDMSSVKLI